MSDRQREWNQFEAVILLEGFLDALCGKLSREDSISRVSHDLREMAYQQGEEIDETFRNEAGITFQMHSMESAFRGYTVFKPATKLFSDTVELYRKNNPEYKRLLEAAKAIINGEMLFTENKEGSLKTEFMSYLGTKLSSAKMSESYWCYDEIEKYCLKKGLLEKPLFETTDLNRLKNIREVIDNSASFRFTHRGTKAKISAAFYFYYKFICEKTEEEEKTAKLQLDKGNSLTRTNNDSRLLKKYPVIFKRVFYVLRDSTINGNGLKLNEIQNLTQRIARASEIEDILDNASWANFKEGKYWFSNDIVNHNNINTENVIEKINVVEIVDESQKGLQNQQEEIIDFENLNDLVLTTPRYFTYFDEKHGPFSKWEELYLAFVSVLCDDYPHKFHSGMSFSSQDEKVDMENYKASTMVAPAPILGTDYIIETNLDANQMVAKMKYVLDFCCVDYENVKIIYQKKDSSYQAKRQNILEQQSREKNTDTITESIQKEFRNWLVTSSNLAKRTIDSYVSSINRCEFYAKEHNYPDWHIYSFNAASVMKVMTALKNDAEFTVQNESQHHQLSAALSKYKQFLDSKYVIGTVGRASVGVGEASTSKQWKAKFGDQISQILEIHYPFGFRVGSSIEIMRFRNFADQDQVPIPDSDEELEREIIATGMMIDRKIYFFNSDFLDEMKAFVNHLLRDGTRVLFFDPFIEINAKWMEEHFVSSIEILKAILSKLFPDFYFAPNFFSCGEKESEHKAIVMEIHRVIKDQRVILFSDLCMQLPYIPSNKIAWSLSASDDFVWISEGKYFVMEHFVINKDEVVNIQKFVADECERKGYVSMADLSYDNILEENFELTPSALYAAVYNTVLKSQYNLNGKILTLDSDVDAGVLLRDYCRERENCTLSDVMNKSQELIGAKNRKLSFAALYDTKIRINKDLFIPESQVQFDINQVDLILQKIIGDRFAPIKSITTFVMFPSCGQSWNHYLLESFCYRFSKKYRLCVVNFNNKNAGIISAKSLNMSYTEMLCESAAKSDIELIPDAVGHYFFENGLMAKSSFPYLDEITEQASKLRKGC